MSKHDFARRLKRMVHNECEIVKLESKIAHKSAKHYEQLSSLKNILDKQEQELSIYRKEVNKLKMDNEQLQKYKQNEEERLCTTRQKIEQMQSEYESILPKQIEQRRLALMQMDCMRSIKEATQTYINMDALPQMIQGVIIRDNEESREWVPFCIDPLKHTQKEVQDIIWDETNVDTAHREAWKKLILGDILEDEVNTVNVQSDSIEEVN